MKAYAKGLAVSAAALMLVGCGKGPATIASPMSAKSLPAQAAPAKASRALATAARQTVEGPTQAAALALPTHTETKSGLPGDPVNLAIAGSEADVLLAFEKAGWVGADAVNVKSTVKMIVAAITFKPYETSPMSDLYLYGRVQDHSFQKNQFSVHTRDHLRIWDSGLKNEAGQVIWAVAATEDISIKWDPATRSSSHQIHPFIDNERALVEKDLKGTGMVAHSWKFQHLPKGYRGVNGSGDPYTTDGQVAVLELKPSAR